MSKFNNRVLDYIHKAISFLTTTDQNFKLILEKYGQPIVIKRPEGFATLCKIILEQQVSLASAKACFDKLEGSLVDFTPRNILNCSDEHLRFCGLSRQKSVYVKALAEAIVHKEIDLTSFRNKSVAEIRSELIKIKGIGHWTIDIYLMLALQSPDVLPLGDIGIISTINELWNVDDKLDIARLAASWQPHRTFATFFIWHYYLKKRGRIMYP